MRHLLLAMAMLLACAHPAHAGTITSAADGYRLELPDDWTEIPRKDLTDKFHDPQFRAVYKPPAQDGIHTYPFLLIEVAPYTTGAARVSITEQELQKIAEDAGTPAPPETSARFLNHPVPPLTSRPIVTYSTSPPGITTDVNTYSGSTSAIRVHTVTRFAKDHVVLVHLYAERDRADDVRPVVQLLATSFRLDAAHEIPLREPPRLLLWLLVGGAVFLMAAAAISLAVVFFARRLKKA